LRLLVLEKVGHDPLLPTYGSRLDGGVIDGEELDSYIGTLATQENLNQIRIEIIRLIENYQQEQFDKMANETIAYGGRNTFEEDEVIDDILNVEVIQIATTILIRVLLTTLAGTTLKVTVPITPEA